MDLMISGHAHPSAIYTLACLQPLLIIHPPISHPFFQHLNIPGAVELECGPGGTFRVNSTLSDDFPPLELTGLELVGYLGGDLLLPGLCLQLGVKVAPDGGLRLELGIKARCACVSCLCRELEALHSLLSLGFPVPSTLADTGDGDLTELRVNLLHLCIDLGGVEVGA